MTVYDNKTISYDELGNPVSYMGKVMTWVGRKLTSMTEGNDTISYTYDSEGIRTTKTINGQTIYYDYIGSQHIHEDRGEYELYYSYDENGSLVKLTHVTNSSSTEYYVTTTMRVDVEAIYDGNGTLQARYIYDSWEKIISILDSNNNEITDTNHIGHINPIRYRGYHYDNETGFYYVLSRYYDQEVGRWISADDIAYLGTGGLTSYNLFAYCGNNPIMGYDPHGTFDFWGFAKGVGRIVTGIVAIATGAALCVAGASIAIIVVAAVTITAGVLTGVNGAADIQQAVTGDKFVRDTVFNGNQTAYDVYSGTTEAFAIIGTIASGTAYSLQMDDVLQVGNIKGIRAQRGYPGIRFTDKSGAIRSLELHSAHEEHGIHLQLNNWWLHYPKYDGKYYRAFSKHLEIFKFWKGWF